MLLERNFALEQFTNFKRQQNIASLSLEISVVNKLSLISRAIHLFGERGTLRKFPRFCHFSIPRFNPEMNNSEAEAAGNEHDMIKNFQIYFVKVLRFCVCG